MVKICVICSSGEAEDEPTTALSDCNEKSFQRIKEFLCSWNQLGRHNELYETLKTVEWSQHQFFHHSKCYNGLTHSGNLNKLKTSQRNSLINSNSQKTFDLALCFVCQVAGNGKVSTVTKAKVAQEIWDVKENGSSELKARFETFIGSDALLNQIKYHSNCLNTEKRKLLSAHPVKAEDKYARINIEFITLVKHQLTSLNEDSPSYDMNELVDQYGKFIQSAKLPLPVATMRRYIKSLMEADAELMSKVDFYHFEPCKPTVVANKLLVSKLLCENHFQKESAEANETMKTVDIIRKELSSAKEWEFNGSFGNYETPPKLLGVIKQILAGSYMLNEKKQAEIDVVSRNIAQYICSNFKSNRQLTYQSSKERGFEKHRLTPLSVGTALVNYQTNRSKCEIENLSRIGLCINYDKLERIVTAIAVSLMKEALKNGLGIILPPSIKKGIRPIFAADNIDFGSDAGSFHGADIMIVQGNEENRDSLFPEYNFQTKSQERSLPSLMALQIDENVCLTDDNDTKYKCEIAVSNASDYWQEFQKLNGVWLLLSNLKMLSTTNHASHTYKAFSWSSFHSTISSSPNELSNVAIVAPLYRRSPTQVPVLIDILKRAMNITVLTVGTGTRAIITLDGDLYKNAVKVPNYKEKWIIRLGSLHTIIAALKCLGKYIEGSGMDIAWEMSGLYGPVTVNQIIDGRHIYRGIRAHTVTLIALHSLYTECTLTEADQQTIKEICSVFSNAFSDTENDFAVSVINAKQKLSDVGILAKLNLVASPTRPTAVFLCNYMRQVMNLLNYIGATRLRNWMQHLATKEEMVKYFHAHDQSNYLKWALLYIADMLELQTSDPDSWKFLEDGNFAVSKNIVPFTSIDPDHAIEHEHRPMKMKGGFVNITQKEKALDRCVLTLPILGQISEEYKRYSSIKLKDETAKMHHELYGNFFANQLSSAQKLINELSSEGNPFNYPNLRNLMNFSVPRDAICNDILKRDVLGEASVNAFRKERMLNNSEIGFWSPYTRKNFKMFSDKEITIMKAKSTVTTLKEEKLLYSRMMIISRTRPELCPKKIVGEYELTNIPPSNFSPDGTMIIAKSNATLIDLINEMADPTSSTHHNLSDDESAIIIDGMYILEVLKSFKSIENVGKLVNAFQRELVKALNDVSHKYSELRLVFPRFVPDSLNELQFKSNTTKTANIRYHVCEKTPIKKLETFLADIHTRVELTAFLGQSVLRSPPVSDIKIFVGYGSTFYSNDHNHRSNILNQDHTLEDVPQLILINLIDLKNNGIQTVYVKTNSVDTVVVLLGHKNMIPYTIIRGGWTCHINNMYNRLGTKKSNALIGWYAMQGMVDKGSFYGKGVKSHFKALEKSDDNILSAFSSFGETSAVTEEIMPQMERYICLLYGSSTEKTIQDIRFSMSAIIGREGKNLPPTLGTLIPHVYRAFYSALLCKLAITLHPEIPHPTEYYWNNFTDNTFQPILCINDALPAALLDFKQCNCKAATKRCTRLSCTCLKFALKCTELCGCGDQCENLPVDEVVWEENDGEMWEECL